ncbi:MAG: hypothetical protein Q8M11_18965 [Sulfuritalea sp.]|nr:hypothetical protein [Sulfuritalea sp.]MDP1983396.1 hypothetical protein [Sulfuritalea sp.]
MKDNAPGRACPLSYRYGATALARCRERDADTLYVIGGLYGNRPALAAIEALAAGERGPVTLCFNGDFNWFNVDDDGFAAINSAVLQHDACLGNVEAELTTPGADAGCGCAYPESVDSGVVERSNAIHARLKATAQRHPELLARLRDLPMVRRYRVGDSIVGVVHGDADSLAGWRFDVAALDDDDNRQWLAAAFAQAGADVFAGSHTCLPALRRFAFAAQDRIVINNGAAGMPNFAGVRCGLITRIATQPGTHPPTYGIVRDGICIEALAVPYAADAWEGQFLANWPAGSAAHTSYFARITEGPDFSPALAQRFDRS